MNEQTSRWYMVNKDGMCTLCADQADAEQEAKNAQEAWPHMGPHRAVRLVEVGDAGFTAGQMVAYADATHAARAQADSVLEDAARYRWLREGNDAKHGAAWHVAVNLYGCEWDAAIDTARKQGANHE